MSTSTANTKISYVAPRYLAEAAELRELLTCGQKRGYHVRGTYSIHHKGSYEPVKDSLAIGNWLPARFLRERMDSEPDLPRMVLEPRTLSAHTVANHLGGTCWVGVAPPSWVSWFAFDIDLAKGRADSTALSDEEAQSRCDAVLSAVWRAFDFGTGRLPVLLQTPGGGYHVYVPLARAAGGERDTWPAHVIRERVIARLGACGLKLRDGELELWPSGKILRLPMGRQMCLLHAQNPDDPDYLGLVPMHATWGTRTDPRTKEKTPTLRRDIGAGVRAFIDEFEAARRPLAEWLLDDEADWSKSYGPFGDVPPTRSSKNSTLTSRGSHVSQQYEEGRSSMGELLLRGEFFRKRISKLLRTGLTVEGGRHDAALKLTYYFGVCLGLGESDSLAALANWLREFEHVSSYRKQYGQEKFQIQTLREARHYYRNVVVNVGGVHERRGLPLGIPLGDDLTAFAGKFSCPAVEEAALCLVRFIKGYADSEGMVREPVELAGTLLHTLCGERRVSHVGPDGKKRRVRATQLAIAELTAIGVLTLYKNYRPDHHGRFFCCWYQFGSGALPFLAASGDRIIARTKVPEGELALVSAGGILSRAQPCVQAGVGCSEVPAWVSRMYERHNFAPGDLRENLSEQIGSFRDYALLRGQQDFEVETDRETGVVVAFADDAGYGFIAPDKGGADLFCHQTSICQAGFRNLLVGARVEFTRVIGAKGGKALWVTSREPPTSSLANDNGCSGTGVELCSGDETTESAIELEPRGLHANARNFLTPEQHDLVQYFAENWE